MIDDDDDFDENDMMAAIEAEQAEKAAADGDDEEFDENDMMAAIAAEQAERGDGGGDDGGDDFDENDMMAAIAAEQAERGGGDSAGGGGGGGGSDDARLAAVSAVENIGVDITAVLGVADMKVSNLLKIGRGAVIELNRRVGDAVELRVAGRPIAKGDVVVVEDHLAVSVTEVFKRSTVPQD